MILFTTLIQRFEDASVELGQQKLVRFKYFPFVIAKYDDLNISFRVLNVFKRWSKSFWKDFSLDPLIPTRVVAFLQEVAQGEATYANTAKVMLAAIEKHRNSPQVFPVLPPIPIKPTALRTDLASLFNLFSIEDIARQLTLMEWQLFQQLRPEEFHDTAWMKEERKTKAPNGVLFSLFFFARI
jgi:son of sevenless-like protein